MVYLYFELVDKSIFTTETRRTRRRDLKKANYFPAFATSDLPDIDAECVGSRELIRV